MVILLIVGLILITIFIISLLYICKCNREKTYKSLQERFDDTSTQGGLLIHMMMYEQFISILNSQSIEIEDMVDCGTKDRFTCSAWTLLRKDLAPMPFIFPGMNTTLGIIVDPKKIWSLLTTMAIIDSDTNNRSCCTNNSGSSIVTKSPKNSPDYYKDPTDECTSSVLKKKSPKTNYDNWAAYIENNDLGANCPSKCDPEDDYCKYVNAGGGTNTYVNNMLCTDAEECYNFEEIKSPPDDIKNLWNDPKPDGFLKQTVKSSCGICTKPYLCVADSPPDGKNTIKNENKRIAAYVGKNAELYPTLFYKDDILGDRLSTGRLAGYACKFERKDWQIWTQTIQNYYKELLALMNPDNSIKTEYFNKYNYLNSNPEMVSYLENEVNIYVSPDKNTDIYKQQNKQFLDSIIGFFYIDNTCETQLKSLSTIPTQVDGQTKFENNIDRCNYYFGETTTDKRNNMENLEIYKNKKILSEMITWFNNKYNKKINGYGFSAASNSYPDYKVLSTAIDNKTDFNKYFHQI
jgi:hypothetical protein